MSKQRVEEIDILKGIAIILMVAGHAGAPFTDFVYLFHMAVFFIASGFCLNVNKFDSLLSLKSFVISKIKSLYIPCCCFNLSMLFLNNIFAKLYLTDVVYSKKELLTGTIKCLLFSGGGRFSGAMWFLRTLFVALIIYAGLVYIEKIYFENKNKFFTSIVCIGSLMISWFVEQNNIGGGYINILSVLILLHLGVLFKTYYDRLVVKLNVGTLLISFIWLLLLNHYGAIELNRNQIQDPVFFLAASVFGFWGLMSMSMIVKPQGIRNSLIMLGKNTLPIVMYHFLAFKIVTVLQIAVYDMPIEKLSAYPILISTNSWWIVYTAIGILFPLCFDSITRKIKRRIYI